MRNSNPENQFFARRIPLIVNDQEGRELDGQSRICNWLYNHLLSLANEDFDLGKPRKLMSSRNLRDLIPELKEEHPFLKAVHASPLKNTAVRLKQSFQDFFKLAERGHPKFRS